MEDGKEQSGNEQSVSAAEAQPTPEIYEGEIEFERWITYYDASRRAAEAGKIEEAAKLSAAADAVLRECYPPSNDGPLRVYDLDAGT